MTEKFPLTAATPTSFNYFSTIIQSSKEIIWFVILSSKWKNVQDHDLICQYFSNWAILDKLVGFQWNQLKYAFIVWQN